MHRTIIKSNYSLMGKKELVDLSELGVGKMDRLRETVSTWLPALKMKDDFWSELQNKMKDEVSPPRTSVPLPIHLKENSSSTSTSSSPAQMDDPDMETEQETVTQQPQSNTSEQVEPPIESET